jgi:hypothetical protein
VRSRVVQALLRQRRVARHIRRMLRHEPHRHQVGLDPPLRPKQRARRAHLVLQLPEERAHHAILPPIAQPLLLLRRGALRLLLLGVCANFVVFVVFVIIILAVVVVLFFVNNRWPLWTL